MVIGFSVETKENTSTQVPKTTFIDAQNRLHTPTDQKGTLNNNARHVDARNGIDTSVVPMTALAKILPSIASKHDDLETQQRLRLRAGGNSYVVCPRVRL